jgi:hypothetical protein
VAAVLALVGRADADKRGVRGGSPVRQAIAELPEIAPAKDRTVMSNSSIDQHLGRIAKAPDARTEAAEIESLVAWAKEHKLTDIFRVSLGHRCPQLTDEELLALSKFPKCTVMIEGGTGKAPVILHRVITFRDSKNVLRLVAFSVRTKGGLPVEKR